VGIVVVKTTGYNQHGTTVITFKRTIMVYRKNHAPKVARPFSEEHGHTQES
jgi:itaconyl-CoA hydratase